jgi:YVTN family beta-propeller protein
MANGLQPKVFLAGRVAVEIDGLVVDEARFPGRQSRLLFAYLVAEQGRAVPRDELAEALWGDATPATWDKALTGIVSRLRGLLTDGGMDGASVLTGAFGCYRLQLPEGSWVDIVVAANAVQAAEEALAADELDSAKAAAALAASLLQRPFLPGEEGEWVEEKRREFVEIRGRALSALADAYLRSGDPSEAATWAEQTITLAPYRETGYRRLMEAHAAAGNRAEALQVYERCRHLLAEELGTYPSPETEGIYRGLLEAPSAPEMPQPVQVADRDHERESLDTAGRRALPRVRKHRLMVVLGCGAIAATAAAAAAVVLLTAGGPDSATAAVSPDSVGAFDARTGSPIAQVPIRTGPSALAAGMGAIWVANVDDGSVSKIDPRTNALVDTIPVGNGPGGIAVGGGYVWVTNSLDGTVSRIDPKKATTPVQKITVGNGPLGVAYGEGAVWVANSSDRTVTEINPRTGVPHEPIPVPAGADGIAVGDDAVWVTSESAGSLSRIDPRARIVTQPINVGEGASAVAVGLRAVWVANSVDGTVTRVDPARDAVSGTTTVGAGPSGIAASPDGKTVWVSSQIAGTLSRIDPAQVKVLDTVTTGNRPSDVAMSGNSVYVAVRASGLTHRGGRLTVLTSLAGDESIDPAVAFDNVSWSAITLTNDGLVGFKRVGGNDGTRLVPDLATTIPTPTDGGRTYTFQVRRGVHYSNGALVRPADFRRGVERSVATYASTGLGSAFLFSSIVGYDRCLKAPEHCDLARGIVADPSSSTVTFHLATADSDFLYRLALPAGDAVPAKTPLSSPPLPATGPYMIASFDAARGLRLVRNPHFREWYAAAQPSGYPDEIVWRFNVAPSAQRRGVENRRADVASDAGFADEGFFPPVALLTALQTRYASQLHLDQEIQTYYVFLNTRIPPFDNLKARQAVNYAVDRNRMVDLRGGPDHERPTCQVLPPNFNGYQRYCPYTTNQRPDGSYTGPDLAKARRLMAESGTRGQEVTVGGIDGIFEPHGGDYFVSVLRSLGYRARFKNYKDADTYYGTAGDSRSKLQAGIGAWQEDYPSVGGFLPPLLTCKSFVPRSRDNLNLAEFCNRHVDAEIARARALEVPDPGAASRIWRRVDHDVVRLAPWVFLQNELQTTLVSRRVGNYQYNPQWGPLLDQLWVR